MSELVGAMLSAGSSRCAGVNSPAEVSKGMPGLAAAALGDAGLRVWASCHRACLAREASNERSTELMWNDADRARAGLGLTPKLPRVLSHEKDGAMRRCVPNR